MSNSIPTSNPLSIPSKKNGWPIDIRDLSTTPGGTLYSTTPGGTRIVYDRNMLLQLQNSPLSKSPINLDHIPGISKLNNNDQKPKTVVKDSTEEKTNSIDNTSDVFKMD